MTDQPTLYEKVVCDGAPHPDGWVHAREWDMVPVEPAGYLHINKHGVEGEPGDRMFSDDGGGLPWTDQLEPGEYVVIKIGETR